MTIGKIEAYDDRGGLMKKDNNGWIDPAIARRLMLEYQNAIGIKGGSEIERRIHAYTKLGLHRKTIENWLRDPHSVASPQTLKIVLRFLHTAIFRKLYRAHAIIWNPMHDCTGLEWPCSTCGGR